MLGILLLLGIQEILRKEIPQVDFLVEALEPPKDSYSINETCESYRETVTEMARDYDMEDYVDLILAVMMQESAGQMVDIMESDYVLFARARGESPASIALGHGLRNVALPALTLQFASVSEIIGGSVLVEQVFSYPGLGQAAVDAGLGSDLPLFLGITVLTAAIVFGGNLAADLLYGAIDPRIRRGAART